MPELQIVIQIFTIIVLFLLAVMLGYLVVMLYKINRKVDTLLEIITYYEKIHEIIKSVVEGPGKKYYEIIKTTLAFVTPLLTKSGKDK